MVTHAFCNSIKMPGNAFVKCYVSLHKMKEMSLLEMLIHIRQMEKANNFFLKDDLTFVE